MANKDRLPPIHPGEILREEFLSPLGMSAHQLAMALRVPAIFTGGCCPTSDPLPARLLWHRAAVLAHDHLSTIKVQLEHAVIEKVDLLRFAGWDDETESSTVRPLI